MASLIQGTNSLLGGGRNRVTIIGLDKNKTKVEIELDLVETFEVTANTQISNHAIEKDPQNPVSKIADHVSPDNPSIACNCILSDNLNLGSSARSLSNKAQSAKDKLKQILYWQKTGSVLTIEGYTVGSNAFGKVLNYLNSGIGNFNSSLDEPYYLGTVTDKIENVLIGNITHRNKTDLGNNVEVTLSFSRVKIVSAATISNRVNSSKAGTTPQKQGKTEPKEEKPKKPIKESKFKELRK